MEIRRVVQLGAFFSDMKLYLRSMCRAKSTLLFSCGDKNIKALLHVRSKFTPCIYILCSTQNANNVIPVSVSQRLARTLLKRLLSKNLILTHNLNMLLDTQEPKFFCKSLIFFKTDCCNVASYC